MPPYSAKDYAEAKEMGLDLNNWQDYMEYYELKERSNEL